MTLMRITVYGDDLSLKGTLDNEAISLSDFAGAMSPFGLVVASVLPEARRALDPYPWTDENGGSHVANPYPGAVFGPRPGYEQDHAFYGPEAHDVSAPGPSENVQGPATEERLEEIQASLFCQVELCPAQAIVGTHEKHLPSEEMKRLAKEIRASRQPGRRDLKALAFPFLYSPVGGEKSQQAVKAIQDYDAATDQIIFEKTGCMPDDYLPRDPEFEQALGRIKRGLPEGFVLHHHFEGSSLAEKFFSKTTPDPTLDPEKVAEQAEFYRHVSATAHGVFTEFDPPVEFPQPVEEPGEKFAVIAPPGERVTRLPIRPCSEADETDLAHLREHEAHEFASRHDGWKGTYYCEGWAPETEETPEHTMADLAATTEIVAEADCILTLIPKDGDVWDAARQILTGYDDPEGRGYTESAMYQILRTIVEEHDAPKPSPIREPRPATWMSNLALAELVEMVATSSALNSSGDLTVGLAFQRLAKLLRGED